MLINERKSTMSTTRKNFSPEQKVRLLRLHLIEKEPVSDICDRHGLNPNVFYRWQKLFFLRMERRLLLNRAMQGRP
ncbi:MAG: hypothetical protein DRP83_06335 [Planctomycetota bacterium]|nr:MAG: hypothetical protein DRP83_06335 [Planctomycetota bacterium]